MNNAFLLDLIRQRDSIGPLIEAEAAKYVRDWLIAHNVMQIRIDDEHEVPGYALDYDDGDLNVAIGNLSPVVITNPTKPAWNPVVTLKSLNAYLNA